MVEFNHPYLPPPAYGDVGSAPKKIEDPIYPMSEVGITIPEIDQTGRHKNLVQIAQAAIRGGAGVIQLMFQVPHTSAGQGRPHMYGKDVRQQLKEVFAQGGVRPAGVELPTSSMTNMSGLDLQRGTISEETRKQHLDEVKAAINFVGDVFQGGGTDIVSWEFPRHMFDASWNKTIGENDDGSLKHEFENFKGEGERPVVRFVDTRSDQIVQIPVDEIPLKYDPSDPDKKIEKFKHWKWADFQKAAQVKSEKTGTHVSPHELLKDKQFESQMKIAQAEAEHRREMIEQRQEGDLDYKQALRKLKENDLEWDSTSQEKREELLTEKELRRMEYYEAETDYIENQERMSHEHKKRIESLIPLEEYAKDKAIQSYVDAAEYAMSETHRKGAAMRNGPLFVGPEIGWPHSYGGHPDEFIELVNSARDKFADDLVNQGFDGKKFTKEQALKEAQIHIKGTFDTGHMGMWLKHFRPDLPYHERVSKFNAWYLDKANEIAKAGVTGNIQMVDAHGGEHGHLPAGQGILPIQQAMKQFKDAGFHGHIVSEGHEEEKYGEGRIRTQAWKLMHSQLGRQYGLNQPISQVHQGYFGRTYAPRQMFGAYTPPFGEYKPWSELPFE